jgi:small-conductance mechanosensitive channel
MTRFVNLPALMIAGLLAACAGGWYFTLDQRSQAPGRLRAAEEKPLVDQRLIETAQSIAALAETTEERDLSREALRLSDHELDLAFATALREAAATPPPAAGPLHEIHAKIAKIDEHIAADQGRIAALTKKGESGDEGGQLELAKAQLALDQDERSDAQQELLRKGGDRRARVQQAIAAHETAGHQQAVRYANPAPVGTLSQQAHAWLAMGSYERRLTAARQQASSEMASLERAHGVLAGKVSSRGSAQDAADADETAAMVAQLQHLSDQRKTLLDLDRRAQDCQQLADVYRQWEGIVAGRRRAVLHLLLSSMSVMFGILLAAVVVSHTARRTIGKKTDRRRAHQLHAMVRVAVFVAAAVAVLFLVFGPPTQLATFVGLATAGLTVVLKDFIVAFIGWFALMGKNGIRIGDFVEINGVGGEVIEVGVLRTVLLEMGNWTVTGHPTGRRVAFMNGFALEGHYFNFSTAGQWLWDELNVTLPVDGNPYQLAQQIREVVDRETEKDAREAEQEWERVTHQYGTRAFSARPAVEIRPSPLGLEVVVRYITRAPQRYQVKSHLFEHIVALLHKSAAAT